MDDPLYVVMLLAMFSVLVVLAIGLGGFVAGGRFNRKYGNKMMRLRLLFQAIAIVLILLYFYLNRTGG